MRNKTQTITMPQSEAFIDPLTILDRTRTPNHSLRNMLAGRPIFLVVGGPSLKQIPIEQLKQRGVWSIAVNNAAGYCWTNAFVCADPPLKFHHGIWLDPTVMKFVPIAKMTGRRSRLKEKVGEEFIDLERDGKSVGVPDCPNVWAFGRRSWLQPDGTFFTDTDAAWGNHQSGCNRTGQQKTVCTMLLAIRLAYYLSGRGCRIYLLGCSWRMNPEAGVQENYAFGQSRLPDAVKSNNDQYEIAGGWLSEMQNNGTFAKYGLEIYNCYERSALRAFPYVPFDMALQDVLRGFPKEPLDCGGWYEKK